MAFNSTTSNFIVNIKKTLLHYKIINNSYQTLISLSISRKIYSSIKTSINKSRLFTSLEWATLSQLILSIVLQNHLSILQLTSYVIITISKHFIVTIFITRNNISFIRVIFIFIFIFILISVCLLTKIDDNGFH